MKKLIAGLGAFLLITCLMTGCSLSVLTDSPETYSQAASRADISLIADSSQAASSGTAGGLSGGTETKSGKTSSAAESFSVAKDGEYTSKEEVALYIHLYGHLPSNFITKNEARKLGWDAGEGNLDEVAPGKSIGGSKFGNYDSQLPDGSYKECDIDYHGGYRGSKRIIYSTDGRVYYTEDHYQTFEQLY
jgi:guanyl-specific ribonuclease Sa